MTTYLARSAWTSTSASGSSLSGSKLRGVAVHWPGTTQDIIGDPGQESIASRLRSYRNFHVNTRGWSDIGYNFAIDQAGRVWMLRSTNWAGNRVGAHCASESNPDANHEYVGVLLILGDQEQPSTAMLNAFRDWYRNRFLPVWSGRTDVRGHGKVPGASTSCPGARALTLIASGAFTSGVITPPPEEDDMFEASDRTILLALQERLGNVNDPIEQKPHWVTNALHWIWHWSAVKLPARFDTVDAKLAEIKAAVGTPFPVEELADAVVARLDGSTDATLIRSVLREELANLQLSLNATPNP